MGGYGGRSERRRLAVGQPAVSEQSPPSLVNAAGLRPAGKNSRVARLLAREASAEIIRVSFQFESPQYSKPLSPMNSRNMDVGGTWSG